MDDQLARIREWAQGKVDALQEQPWTTRRSQHVIALIDEMVASQSAAVCREESRQPPGRVARCLPRGGNVIPLDSARRRRAMSAARR
jgi:hypothetical protein